MDDINDIIDEAIISLADDNIKVGAEALICLAQHWAKAGLTKESFYDMRKFIIDQATEKTDVLFVKEKLIIIERELQNGRKIVVH